LTTEESLLLEYLDDLAPDLVGLAREIGEDPELGYQEHRSVGRIERFLGTRGIPIAFGLAGLPTAFETTGDRGHSALVVVAEYDALPDIGHACGHNLIAASAVGAYLALRAAAPRLPVRLVGTPAEESAVAGAGGKIRLLRAGCFDDATAAIMIHPYEHSGIVSAGALAARGVDFVFTGKAAHAAMHPEEGVNALDAAVLAYTGISHLRQQLAPEVRVHGVVADGGGSPNVIPDRAALKYRIRSATIGQLEETFHRVLRCAEGAALATGAHLDVDEFMPPYAEMRQDPRLAEIASRVLEDLRIDTSRAAELRFGSSDFGNVSHRVPSLEIGIGVSTPGARPHTSEFARAAVSPEGLIAAVSGAKAIALTALRSMKARE